MDNSKKVAFLVQYSRMKERIVILLERRRAYQDDIYGIKATRYTDEPKCGGLPTGLDNKVVKLLTVSEDIDKELEDLTVKMGYIKSVVARLTNYKYRSILELKYIDGMTIKQIESVLDCSLSNVHYYTKKALRALPLEDEDLDRVL